MKKNTFNYKVLVMLPALALGSSTYAQRQPHAIPVDGALAGAKGNAVMPSNGIKPYNQVITDKAVTQKGLFTVHTLDDRYYIEMADSIIGRDILIVNRIAKAAAEVRSQMLGYAGDEIGQNVIRFQKGPQDKIYMIRLMTGERSKDSAGMYHSLLNSSIQPVIASFPVKAYHQDSVTNTRSTVIDITEMITGDNELFYFNSMTKMPLMLGGQMPDRSYVIGVKTFPANMEIRALKTYSKGSLAATYELNSSVVLLPAQPMKPRFSDDRIGYFTTSYTDYDANPQGIKKMNLVIRWRLEPKPEDVEKYQKGELVEPVKPIVFYIDPSTPRKWIPYLIKGVNDWQSAFEKAGFKNAIRAEEAPDDSTWSLEDARHSAIVYKPSSVPNATGSEVYDPRTGEIIEAHINWYHNIMKLVHDWYQVQAGAVDPGASKQQFDDSLMGQLIRFVSSHEVGHTLGLMHNYGSSSTVPVDSLRSKTWLQKYGHTPSIMDYARFNYVAQPEDHVGREGIFPRIGDYDKWAIEWGYTFFPDSQSANDEQSALNKLVAERLKNKRLFFGSENTESDPRCQNEDLGDNAMKAGAYGIKNLKRILSQIIQWTSTPGEGYGNAKVLFTELMKQYNQYIWHVCKNIGGVYYTPKTAEQPGAVYQPVPGQLQRQAVQFLNEQLFTTPAWLFNKPLQELAGIDVVMEIKNAQIMAFSRMFTSAMTSKMVNENNGSDVYTLSMYLTDLENCIWSELPAHQTIDIYRRNLQSLYVESLSGMMRAQKFPQNSLQIWQGLPPGDLSVPDISSIARGHMQALYAKVQQALPNVQGVTRYHLEDVAFRINKVLKAIQ